MSNPGLRKELANFYKEIDSQMQTGDSQPTTSDLPVQAYYSKMFHHCVVQGLLQILTSQHQILSTLELQEKGRKTLLQKILKIVFKQGQVFGGL